MRQDNKIEPGYQGKHDAMREAAKKMLAEACRADETRRKDKAMKKCSK